MSKRGIITMCKDCGGDNHIPYGPNFMIDVEGGITTSCEWCGSKNIERSEY